MQYGQDMDKMNWLEKKILLQILKIQLERLANSNMKVSWNLFFQAVATAAQYGNQALDIAPAKSSPSRVGNACSNSIALLARPSSLVADATISHTDACSCW
jgi:hypothetical protein